MLESGTGSEHIDTTLIYGRSVDPCVNNPVFLTGKSVIFGG